MARTARSRGNGLVLQAVERLDGLCGPAGAIKGQAEGVLIFLQTVRVGGHQLAGGFDSLQRLLDELGLACGAKDRQPGRFVQRLGIFTLAVGNLQRRGSARLVERGVSPDGFKDL